MTPPEPRNLLEGSGAHFFFGPDCGGWSTLPIRPHETSRDLHLVEAGAQEEAREGIKRHFAIVLRLIPNFRLSSESEACDRCSAVLTACGDVAQP